MYNYSFPVLATVVVLIFENNPKLINLINWIWRHIELRGCLVETSSLIKV